MSVKSDHAERWDYMQELLSDTTTGKDPTKIKRKYIIRREDNDCKTYGWRVELRIKGVVNERKYFPDSVSTGKAPALLAAICWRDKKIKELGLTNIRDLKKTPFNKSAGGVFQTSVVKGGHRYSVVIAQWVDHSAYKNAKRQKSYSVNKYGLKKALRLAKKHRKDILKELYG